MFCDTLKNLREAQGLTQKQLASILGISKGALANYECGLRFPKDNNMWIKIAQYFNVTVDFLMDAPTHIQSTNRTNVNTNTIVDSPTTSEYVVFPVIGEIAAGYNQIPIEDWEGETIPIHIDNLKGRPKDSFIVLEVKGDSMFPEFQDGDKVLIQKQETLEYSGQVGAMIYDGEYTTLKKVEFKYGEDWLNLVPINPNYKTERIEGVELERCKVIGFPVLLIREYN